MHSLVRARGQCGRKPGRDVGIDQVDAQTVLHAAVGDALTRRVAGRFGAARLRWLEPRCRAPTSVAT